MKTIKLIIVIVSISFISSTHHSIAQNLSLDDFMPFEMPVSPMKASYATSSKAVKNIKLTQLSVKKNKIIDTDSWFYNNQLTISRFKSPNTYFYDDERTSLELSPRIPLQSGAIKLQRGTSSEEANCYVYGIDHMNERFLLITNADDTEILHFLNFDNFQMEIIWTAVEDNVLYVSHSSEGYASELKGINAFITAIDLETMDIIWRSDPLVANAKNFEIIEDNIVCGYGFTAEPDFLFVLDKYTGKKLNTIKLASAPDYIIRKNDKLFVRTYNRDYVFEIEHNP